LHEVLLCFKDSVYTNVRLGKFFTEEDVRKHLDLLYSAKHEKYSPKEVVRRCLRDLGFAEENIYELESRFKDLVSEVAPLVAAAKDWLKAQKGGTV